jgi:hypothetical protein
MEARSSLRSRYVAVAIVAALASFCAIVAAENLAVAAFVASMPRFVTDFSPAFLRYAVGRAAKPGETVFLGDSVLWGYRLAAERNAVALLAARGCACRNLAFKSGNSANDYLIARLLTGAPQRPSRVVIEINQASFNKTNDDYANLHPAVASAASEYLSPAERAMLAPFDDAKALARSAERSLPAVSSVYAFRSDLREWLFGDTPSVALPRLNADLFAGVYDLVPLDESNVGVHFLEKTADALRSARVPLVAFMTPTNHALLHDYIDNALYRNNEAYLRRLLEARGARVVDFDRAVPADEFFDNAHLTAAGQERLARLLASSLGLDERRAADAPAANARRRASPSISSASRAAANARPAALKWKS